MFTIIHGDSLTEMQKLPDGSIDLVVTSPPYNLKNSTGNGLKDPRGGKWRNAALSKGYDTHSDDMPYSLYVQWQRDCLAEMLRLIPDTGAIFYNHKWRVQNGLMQDRREIVDGFPVRQVIIWRRKGGINFNPGYFLPTYEVIYLIAKPGFRLAPHANAHGDVWDFAQERRNPHPAPFPVALVERIISSTTANIVLDPFMGSGTTGVAAQRLQRHFIGVEISEAYCALARERIAECGTVPNHEPSNHEVPSNHENPEAPSNHEVSSNHENPEAPSNLEAPSNHEVPSNPEAPSNHEAPSNLKASL